MNLPKTLVTIKEDFDGDYVEPTDCAISRALNRLGFPINCEDGFSVGDYGSVYSYKKGKEKKIGGYAMPDGDYFYSKHFREAKETGNYPVLVLAE